MSYSRQTWVNGPGGGTPRSAARFNWQEAGIQEGSDRTDLLELGVAAAVGVDYAPSLALNAQEGALFRIAAAGDLALNDITGGVDGQEIKVEIRAAGADRVLTIAGQDPVTIPAGSKLAARFRFNEDDDEWLFSIDGGGSGGSSSGAAGGVLSGSYPDPGFAQDMATQAELDAVAGAKAPVASPTFTGTVSAPRFVTPPQTVTYAASISLNAATSSVFRVVATGNVAVADITGGADGQTVTLWVFAFGADRVLSFASGAASVTVPSGLWWPARFTYQQGTDEWVLDDGGSGGAATGGDLADGSVTDAKVASAAGITLDKTADATASTGRLAMTNAERTKLAGVATAATANATDAALRDRTTHTGTQSADTLTDGTTNKAFLATERTKLTGIAAGATANSTDATLLARANHTGTQAISTVSGLQTALDTKGSLLVSSSTRTASYTVVAADAGVEQVFDSTSAGTFTLPTDASASIAVGAAIPLRQSNTGQLSVAAASGATLVSRGSALKLAGQHAVAEARKVATNAWVLYGDIST